MHLDEKELIKFSVSEDPKTEKFQQLRRTANGLSWYRNSP